MSSSVIDITPRIVAGAGNPDAGKLNDSSEISNTILSIVYEYALNKFEDTAVKHAAGHPKFMTVVNAFVSEQKQVLMCLPAFPFKSANKAYKVFGTLPDKADELALARLNAMCERIAAVYQPGAKLTIISDGLVYNDLLCVSDRDTFAYGEALREMAVEKGFTHLDFSRLRDLTHLPLPEKMVSLAPGWYTAAIRSHIAFRRARASSSALSGRVPKTL